MYIVPQGKVDRVSYIGGFSRLEANNSPEYKFKQRDVEIKALCIKQPSANSGLVGYNTLVRGTLFVDDHMQLHVGPKAML